MKVWSKRLVGLCVVVGSSTLAVTANGWEKEAEFRTSVHDHAFNKLAVTQAGSGCVVNYSIWFNAPYGGYEDPAKGRNYYRFKVRVTLSEGKTSFSPEFANRAPGKRVYKWSHDTTGEGCWGEQLHKVFNVDIEGCRNRNCQIEPFK